MGNRLVLTGANGFVGRHLTRLASQRGWEVVGLVRTPAASEVVRENGGRPLVVAGLEREPLAAALAGASAAVHLAQIGAERAGATYEAVNVRGTRALAEAAAEAGVARLAFLSGLGVARYGMDRRTTNPYFLSKLAAEVELFRSSAEAVVFRPSYIVGPGDAYVPAILRDLAAEEMEVPGGGAYRLQPVAVRDAAEALLAALSERGSGPATRHRVFDLVGPEPVTYRRLLERVAAAARAHGRPAAHTVREISLAEAESQAASGGYRGMLSDELDCLLCDQVADHRPLEALLGRPLTPLDEALAAAVQAAPWS